MAESSRLPNGGDARLSGLSLRALIAAGLAALLLAVTLVSSIALNPLRDNAVALAEAEGALVSAELSLRTLSQAVVLGEDLELGVADPATAQAARAEAGRVLSDLELRLNRLDDTLMESAAVTTAHDVLAALEQGDIATAKELTAGQAATGYQGLYGSVQAIRDDAEGSLDSTRGWAHRIGSIFGILLVLLVPALAIYAYRRIAHRQVDTARAEMDTRFQDVQQDIAARDEIVAELSRELQTQLTRIHESSEQLIVHGLVADDGHRLVSQVTTEAADLNRRVQNLEALSGSISLSLEDFDIADEVTAAAGVLERAGREVEVASPSMLVHGDRRSTRLILDNLLSNVMQWGGPEVYVTGHKYGDVAVIAVGDNGSGVPREVEAHLFSPNGDTPQATSTRGRGLAAVGALVATVGGSIRHERDGEWTRFVVYLPLAQQVDDNEALAEQRPTDAS
jgi:signal transduction histidine kinase